MTERWVPEVGERVAIYCAGGHMPTVRYDVVERLTKTQIVFANGDRFRRDDLCKRAAEGRYGSRERLCRIDSPEAEGARSRKVYTGARYMIEELLRPKTRGADSYSAPEREGILRDIIATAQRAIELINTPAK